jgi:hypothetical protein
MRKCPKFVRSLSEVAEVCPKIYSVALQTPHKKMSANPRAGILYRKNYNMRYPIFASIILLLPPHAQSKARGFFQKCKTQALSESKPHASKLLTQFLRHLPTHHPEIDMISTILPKLTKSLILKE